MAIKISRRTAMTIGTAAALTAVTASASQATAALGPRLEPIIEPASRHGIDDIQRVVAKHYGLSVEEMLSNVRINPMVRARHTGMYLAYLMTECSLPEIGRRFNGRDHVAVLHAARKMERLRLTEPGWDDVLSDLATKSIAAIARNGHGPAAKTYAQRKEKQLGLAQARLMFDPPIDWRIPSA
jgi:hypothetical protein